MTRSTSNWSGGFLPPPPGVPSGLPVPRIRLTRRVATVPVIETDVQVGALVNVNCNHTLEHVAINIPQALLDDPTLGFQLELMRYRIRSKRDLLQQGDQGGANPHAAYVHPSNAPAPSTLAGSGTGTHGGLHSVTAALELLRITEWPISVYGSVIDLTRSTHAFMVLKTHTYRDAANLKLPFQGIAPASCPYYNGLANAQRYPYSASYLPGYFRFRYSVLDENRPPGTNWRITGPESGTVSLSSAIFPFRPDVPFFNGAKLMNTASLRGDYDAFITQYWMGSTSRLPQ